MTGSSQETALYPVSVCATATVTGDFDSVNALECAIGEATCAAGRWLYVQAFAALQDAWLAMPEPPKEIWVRWPGGRTSTSAIPRGAREIKVEPSGRVAVLR